MKPQKNKRGYLVIGLVSDDYKSYKVHRLVATAYIPNPYNYPEVNHIDGDKENNRVENLEWCTKQYNIDDAIKRGVHSAVARRKLSNEDVDFVRLSIKMGEPKKVIAAFLNVSVSTIYDVASGKSYRQRV